MSPIIARISTGSTLLIKSCFEKDSKSEHKKGVRTNAWYYTHEFKRKNVVVQTMSRSIEISVVERPIDNLNC